MKLRFLVVSVVFVSLILLGNANMVQAQWNAISSGYAVTTNWHGQDVPLFEDVTAIAGTTDSSVDSVTFRWLDPIGDPIWEDPVEILDSFTGSSVPNWFPDEIKDWANDNPTITVYYATDTRAPNTIGDWGVQAFFIDPDNSVRSLRGKNTDIIAIRATSFNVVSEVPFGTIVISLSMFGILGAFILKRKHNTNL